MSITIFVPCIWVDTGNKCYCL